MNDNEISNSLKEDSTIELSKLQTEFLQKIKNQTIDIYKNTIPTKISEIHTIVSKSDYLTTLEKKYQPLNMEESELKIKLKDEAQYLIDLVTTLKLHTKFTVSKKEEQDTYSAAVQVELGQMLRLAKAFCVLVLDRLTGDLTRPAIVSKHLKHSNIPDFVAGLKELDQQNDYYTHRWLRELLNLYLLLFDLIDKNIDCLELN